MDSKIRKSIEDKDFCTCASLENPNEPSGTNHCHISIDKVNDWVCFCLKCKKVLRKDQVLESNCKNFFNKFEKTLYN